VTFNPFTSLNYKIPNIYSKMVKNIVIEPSKQKLCKDEVLDSNYPPKTSSIDFYQFVYPIQHLLLNVGSNSCMSYVVLFPTEFNEYMCFLSKFTQLNLQTSCSYNFFIFCPICKCVMLLERSIDN